jgi:hypothetical protein
MERKDEKPPGRAEAGAAAATCGAAPAFTPPPPLRTTPAFAWAIIAALATNAIHKNFVFMISLSLLNEFPIHINQDFPR